MNSHASNLIAPSILSADFAQLGKEIQAVEAAGADWLHIDVMDGHFVPNLTLGPDVVKSARPHSRLPFDVHLMVSRPSQFIPAFAKAGADWISFHLECEENSLELTRQVQQAGKKAGICIKPKTKWQMAEALLAQIDLVVVMSVEPGFAGQKFMNEQMAKVQALMQHRQKNVLNYLIEVDGGVALDTCQTAWTAGADVLVAGTAVFKAAHYQQAIQALKKKG